MGKKQIDISDFDYLRFQPTIEPSTRRLSNYTGMPEQCLKDETGYVINPFRLLKKKSKRYVLFEALRRGIPLKRIIKEQRLNPEQAEILQRTYNEIKLSYFSHILKK